MSMYLTGKNVRKKENFNKDWFFIHEKDDREKGGRPVTLPHDWSLEYPFDEKAPTCGSGGYVIAGKGTYHKSFCISPGEEGRHIFLQFDGAYMLTRVWINGIYAGKHVYGYTPFEWDITELLKKDGSENIVEVEVDNSAQPSSRWYSGSGITRNVWICSVNPVHIPFGGVWLREKNVTEKQALLTAETRVRIPAGQKGKVYVETELIDPEGVSCFREKSGVQCAESGAEEIELVFCQDFTVEEPCLWDTEHPWLYRTVTRVYLEDRLQDEQENVIGFRSAVFDSSCGFLLNGVRTKINGVCVHHDGGCTGAAVHPRIWERRLEKLKKMGVNAVRMSHNPPDPALLDLCDRMGFLVMDEAFDEWRILKGKELGSNTHESRGYSEWFDQCHEADIRSMLLRDRNHPSIVIWSIGNEVPDQTVEEGRLTARRLKAICRELDGSRPVTQANDQICAEPRAAREDFLEELDVVGYTYVNRWRTRAETMYDDDRRAHPEWCMIGTENSSLGGVRGHYQMTVDEKAGWWTHPYYTAPVEVGRVLRFTMTHDYVAGDFMWTGVDYLGEAHWPARSSSAGVLDTCGYEKDSYYFYKSIWNREEPMAHLLPHWNLALEPGSIVQVLGYTNCDFAELILNGKSYGKKAYSYPAYGMTQRYGHYDREPRAVNTDNLFLSWDVPYEPGCIELVGYRDGREIARDTIYTAGAPAAVRLAVYGNGLAADGMDVCQVEAELVDEKGNFCPLGDCELFFTAKGSGSVVGVDNGNPTSHESMKADHIRAFAGRAYAVVKSVGKVGECVVSVSSAGLTGETVSVRFG